MYIDNVNKKFGGFSFDKVRSPLHPEKLSEHLITQIPAMKSANQNQVKPKPLTARRKSIFTIPLLRRKSIAEPPAKNAMARRKSIAEPPANNGPRKIELRRRTTFVPSETKKEIKPSASRPSTAIILDRNPKLEPKTPRSQTALKRKLPQLESENPAKRSPNNPRDLLMRAIELKTKAWEKNGVVLKQQPQQQQQQPVRPLNGRISIKKTPTKNGATPTTGRSAPKTPPTGRSASVSKALALPSMPNVFDDGLNGNVNGNHVPDPRLRPRNLSSVYQTRRELNITNNPVPRLNGLNGAKSPKSKQESMCQAFMLKMHTGLRELVWGLSEEQNISTNKPDAKMKMLIELEYAKQLELIEEKHNTKMSALEMAHLNSLTARNAAHKKQIEELQKAQFDKSNEMKDKFQAEVKKREKYILQLQEELNALRKRVTPPKK